METQFSTTNLAPLYKEGVIPKQLVDFWKRKNNVDPIESAAQFVRLTRFQIAIFISLFVIGLALLIALVSVQFHLFRFLTEARVDEAMVNVIFLSIIVIPLGIFCISVPAMNRGTEVSKFVDALNDLCSYLRKKPQELRDNSRLREAAKRALVAKAVEVLKVRDEQRYLLCPLPEDLRKPTALTEEFRLMHRLFLTFELVNEKWDSYFDQARAALLKEEKRLEELRDPRP